MNRRRQFVEINENCCGGELNYIVNPQLKGKGSIGHSDKEDVGHSDKHNPKECPKAKSDDDPDIPTYDVIIVGMGMAGITAAYAALGKGATVLMLDSQPKPGGTSLGSGGHLWFCNLSKSKQLAVGIKALNIPVVGDEYNGLPGGFDTFTRAMQYMTDCMYRERFNVNDQYYGVPPNSYNFAQLFYNNGADIFENKYLPAVDAARIEWNAANDGNDLQIIYNPNWHGVAGGFSYTQTPSQIYTVTKDTVVPGSWPSIPGYATPVYEQLKFQTLETDYFSKEDMPGTCCGREITMFFNDGSAGKNDRAYTNISNTAQWLNNPIKYLEQIGGPIKVNTRVIDWTEEENEDECGCGEGGITVTAIDTTTNTRVQYKATKGLVFSTGGFSKNQDKMTKHFQYGDIEGSCCTPGNQGDLLDMAQKNGLELEHLKDGFCNQQCLGSSGNPNGYPVWFNWFSSHMTINSLGERVYSESAKYNERAKAHFIKSPTDGYINKYLFLVVDRKEFNALQGQTYSFYRAQFFQVNDNTVPTNVKIQIICAQIQAWFASVANIKNFVIDAAKMASGFIATLNEYHGYCATGKDLKFQREQNDSGRSFLGYIREQFSRGAVNKDTPLTEQLDYRLNDVVVNQLYGAIGQAYFDSIATYPYTYPSGVTRNICPDIMLQPIIDPVVLVLIPATLDTKGGPLVDANQKIVLTKGTYAAGNCGGYTAMNDAYFGAGATLGPCIYSGWTAGENAAMNDFDNNEDNLYGINTQLLSFMKNTYPGGVISLQLSDAVTFLVAVQGLPDVPLNNPYRVLFKLGLSPNENIPTGTNTTGIAGWITITPTQTQVVDGVRFFKIKLAGNTFPKSGMYFVTFQFIKTPAGVSLGPAFGLQVPITIVEYQNVNFYTYIGTVPAAGNLLLQQNGSAWTGKFKPATTSGFVETTADKNIYIQYLQPGHNFWLNYGIEFDTFADVQLFSNFVYPFQTVGSEGFDGAAVVSPALAGSVFNFKFSPFQPSVPGKTDALYVAFGDGNFYQQWFTDRYNPRQHGDEFPNNELSTHAYITTDDVTKYWLYNKALTRAGKYTVYFYCCIPHRATVQHIGWFLVKP